MLVKYRRQLIISFIIVFLFFFALFFGSFLYLKKYNKPASIKINYYTSHVLKLKNLLPVSDTLGKTFTGKGTTEGVQGYVEFSIDNISNKKATYEIYITEDDELDRFSRIRGDYVKFYLTNKNDAPFYGFESRRLPNYNELPVLVDKVDGKLLYRGVLLSNESERFKLRVWLSDNYSLSNLGEEKEFMVKVNVRSI